ncbi:MAG: hypothetical protein J5935_01880 [Lachnospiraceae bacterium]|nr:hypothetical protein [Lachnospiraceae bacterium]
MSKEKNLDFEITDLCEYRSPEIDIFSWVYLSEGKLEFSGQELGPYTEDVWGDLDYEYWYSLDEEATKKLLREIGGEEDPKGAIQKMFSGTRGLTKLRELCDEKNIPYSFFSYV